VSHLMKKHENDLGQPIGFPVEQWEERPRPPRSPIRGTYCQVVPLDPDIHAEPLYRAYAADQNQRNWTYLPYGPFEELKDFRAWLQLHCIGNDPLFYAIVESETGDAIGLASYLRIEPSVGVIEIGHIHYSPRLQKAPMATEAMYLLMHRVFDELGYRRYEWKCDALNSRSRRAALRLGFTFEGVFRQATIYKGRNRDTAWYSVIDREWPILKKAFRAWLDPGNFNADGLQRKSLSDLVGQYNANRRD